jgi:hypothetical protein
MTKHFSISALLLFVLCPPSATAQTASITGMVTDSTGAVVPNAKISAQNKATNTSRTILTGESGAYRIISLVLGIYDVVIEKPGFKAVEYPRIELTVDQVQNLDATLAPSGVAEKVTVTE